MDISISRPELFNIIDEKTTNTFFGGNQDWYTAEWSRRAGCGPTSAANILAYLALTRPELKALYGFETMSLAAFAQHMEDVYKFVTPGRMGLNRTEMFTDGVTSFSRSRGIFLTPHVFDVTSNMVRGRPPSAALAEFVKAGLSSDCPLGFLNLTKGRVKNLQSWHWITITSASIEENALIAEASDEGRHRRFDLRLWYLSTRLSGGLVYFTH
jgi:hypothetical protein